MFYTTVLTPESDKHLNVAVETGDISRQDCQEVITSSESSFNKTIPSLSPSSNKSQPLSQPTADHTGVPLLTSGWLYTVCSSPVFVHLFSGALAGGVSRTVTAPLDRVKSVLQINRSPQRMATTAGILRSIMKEEGPVGLFRGNGTNCIKVIPECALKFVAYDYFKRVLISSRHQSELPKLSSTDSRDALSDSIETENAVTLSMLEKMIAGGAAGAVAQLAVYPLEVVKTRIATQRHIYRIIECIVRIKKKEGICGFYRGLTPSLLGIIPYAGIDLAVFETLKRAYSARGPPDVENPVAILLLCGGVSSALGQIVSYPLALVRTRLQVDGVDGQPRQFRNMFDVFRKTLQHEGFRALYRGLLPNLMKAVPAVSITWAVYEGCKVHLHRYTLPKTANDHG